MASSMAGMAAAAAAYRLADLDFDVGGRHVLRRHRTRALGLEARWLGLRTLTIVNMPPISTEPKGPSPVIIGAVLSGSGIVISAMSAMPRSAITM